MVELLDFVNDSQGALTLVMVVFLALQWSELRNLKGWVSSVESRLEHLQKRVEQ